MARMPGAVWKPMPGSSTTRMAAYDVLCLHTCVGSLAGTDSWFRQLQDGTNSHFGVGGDGTIWQWVDTDYRSGASYNGNYHLISVESADMGAPFGAWAGSDVPAFTAAQIDALGRIARWAHDTHGIPLTQIPDSKATRRGVGYHRLGVPGYMLPGTEQWSTKTGKVCPGDRRISQVPQVIARALNGETDLDANQAQQLDYVYAVLKGGNPSMDVLSVIYHGLFDALNSDNHPGNANDNTIGHAISGHKYGKQASDKADQIIAALAKLGSAPVSGGSVVAGSLSDADVDRIADALAAKLAGRLQS